MASPPTHIPEDDHWWFDTRTRGLLNVLDRYVRPDGSQRVLDVGCGAGNMMHHLSRYGHVVGVDSFARPLAVCRQRGYEAHLAPAEELPFEDGSMDLVALLDVVEHCDDDVRVFGECYRVCAPGGHIVVTVPAFSWLWTDNDAINGHKRRYTAGQLRDAMTAAGFVPRRTSYAFFFVFPLAAALLVLRRLSGKKQKVAVPRHTDHASQLDETHDDAYQVEMEPTHPVLNAILRGLGRVEAALIAHVDLPVGSSIVAVAQKPASR